MRYYSRKCRALLALCILSPLAIVHQTRANAQDDLDDDIPDVVVATTPTPNEPTKPAAPTTPKTDTAKPAVAPIPAAPISAATVPTTQTPNTTADADNIVVVPRAVWEQLLRDVEELKRNRATTTPIAPDGTSGVVPPIDAPPDNVDAGTPAAPGASTAPVAPGQVATTGDSGEETNVAGNRNYLLLPDISFIGQAKGILSSDKRNEDRNALRLTEGELAIQGTVYPNVAANAFIVGAPSEDEPFQVEEGYLNFIGVRKNLNILVGRKFVPFGRTGEQHNHSWLYARQLLPFQNLVSEEALTGNGALFRYLLPTGKIFTNLDIGIWQGTGAGDIGNDPFGTTRPVGAGASFSGNFQTARLWSGIPLGPKQELELGASYARGGASAVDGDGNELAGGRNTLNGLDISYRKFSGANKRLLLRSEYFSSRPSNGLEQVFNSASGYYGLANYRFSKYADVGLLYENSGFPQAANARENATSLIYTKQFTEQFYTRLQLTRGDSPFGGNYNQAILQFVFGLGPHTHNLE